MTQSRWLGIGSLVMTVGLVGCAGDLSDPAGAEADKRQCHHSNRFCVAADGGTADLAQAPAPPDLAQAPAPPDLAQAPAPPDLAQPPAPPDLAQAPAPDLAQPPDLAPASTCDKAVATTDTGHHHAGDDCSGCHTGGAATAWTVAGTLYDSVTGTNPVVGATIHVKDAKGQSLTLVSAQNGNFYTASPVTYPLQVSASRCPSTVAMNGSVSAPGSCNGCHASTFRVHLP